MAGEKLDWACNEITDALSLIYGEDAPCYEVGGLRQFTERKLAGHEVVDRSGTKPLDCVRTFESQSDYSHWHFVTLGFSDLYSELEDFAPEGESGYGFELTWRLKKGPEDTPPSWPVQVLQNLAEYVFSTGNVFKANQHMPINEPILRNTKGVTIEVVAFAPDPELGTINSESGKIEFLQLVGLTADEYVQMKRWKVSKFLDVLAINNPMFIMDPYRKSICENPDIQKMIEIGVQEDGSSVGASYIDLLEIEEEDNSFKVTLDAMAVEEVINAMKGRIPFDRYFKLWGPKQRQLIFQPGADPSLYWQDDLLVIELNKQAAKEILNSLSVTRGNYSFGTIPNFELVVKPTKIKGKGKNTIKVLGW